MVQMTTLSADDDDRMTSTRGSTVGADSADDESGDATTAQLPAVEETSEQTGAANAALPRSAVFWSYALTVGRFVTTGVVTIVMTSFLQPADYGLMALAM